MSSMIKRTTIREIKGSFGRFFAILAIIALGVGFFSGIKITKQDMVHTINDYLKEKNFFDLHLLSTLGFEESDIAAFEKETDVRYVEGTYMFDVLYSGLGENEVVLKTMALPKQINGIRLLSGRMPENESECVIDSRVAGDESIGTVIRVAETNEADTKDNLKEKEYTIVGIADASYYLNFERGTTSIGNGRIAGFIYVEPEVFTYDYYTDVFVCFQQDYDIYSDEYITYMDDKEKQWEAICDKQANIRYEKIVSDAEQTVQDAKDELEEQRTSGEQELSDAYQKLTDSEKQLSDARKQLNLAWTEFHEQEDTLAEQENVLAEQETKLEQSKQQLQESMNQLPAEQQQMLQTLADTYKQADESQRENLQKEWTQIPGMDGLLQLIQAQMQIEEGSQRLNSAREELEAGKTQLEQGKAELIQQEQKLQESEADLEQGWTDYKENKQKFDDGIAEAETKLEDAEQEIKDIKQPDTYVLNRNTNIGYACFESDSNIVDAVAKVFPVFFILVAALVCMTTMNRMVEEQRTQIGVLKALGYSERVIMGKFMFYSGSAALIGCVLGYAVGTVVFPKVIWYAYGMMYQSLPLDYVFDWRLAGIALAVSLACSIGTTWLSCRYEMEETAASLMRAKAPKAGKRVLLERIPFIWKRLKFLHKVSVRNIFRYKKRFFMMIIGISGCTALLLTGFGIEDSIAGFADQQYEEIQIADGTVGLKQGINAEPDLTEQRSLEKALEQVAQSDTFVSETAWDMIQDDTTKAVNLVVMQKPEEIESYMRLRTEKGEQIAYPGAGQAVINNGLAERYHLAVGDKLVLRNDKMQEITVTVSGVFENRVYNYVFLSPETYTEQLGTEPEYQTIYINYKEGLDIHEAAAELMKEELVTTTTLYQDTRTRMANMMKSLDYVVLLVIVCAAGLAFIVLYNLTNINITERIREIATIKVLGFFRNETAAYVFRENLVLTGIGALVGLGLGVLLHRFVMAKIQVDMVSFAVQIRAVSYVYSVLLTFLFYVVVDRIMAVKLDRINMAESLKSVE